MSRASSGQACSNRSPRSTTPSPWPNPPHTTTGLPKAVTDKARRRQVNVALQRIRETADIGSRPAPLTGPTPGTTPSVAHIGDMLAGLVVASRAAPPHARPTRTDPAGAGIGPSGATGVGTSRGGGRRAARPRAELAGTTQAPAPDPGWTRTTLDVQLDRRRCGGRRRRRHRAGRYRRRQLGRRLDGPRPRLARRIRRDLRPAARSTWPRVGAALRLRGAVGPGHRRPDTAGGTLMARTAPIPPPAGHTRGRHLAQLVDPTQRRPRTSSPP